MLDVTPAELGSFEPQGFTTDQRDGFGLHFAEMAGSEFAVHEHFGNGVSKNDVSDFVERGFVRKRGEWIYGNFPLPRKPLNVAVYFVKRYSPYLQSTERRNRIEPGNRRNAGFFPFGLR